MQFSNGPQLKLNWVTPVLLFIAVLVCIALAVFSSLSVIKVVVLGLNMIGTILLASAFEAAIPKHGDGGWCESLKFAIKALPKYGSPPSFNIIRFYLGLILLLVGMATAAVLL